MIIKCDAIKCSYRQNKDGFVISFVIHPQEMPEELASADIGSQWQLSLVSLDENGNPERQVMPTTVGTINGPLPKPASDANRIETPARATTPTRMAGILCNDPQFLLFLGAVDSKEAANLVRLRCGVHSRRDINFENKGWQKLIGEYMAWRLPQVVA